MRTFGKADKLENVLYDVRGPVLDEATRMEERGLQILKLNIGNPAPFGFNAPEEVIQDMRDNIVHSQGYSDSRGIFAARKAIMQYAQIKHIPNVTMDDIYTGNGASELIQLSLHALLNSGDEVLVPSPDYPLWTACVNLAGGKAVHYICDESSDWCPDIEDIKRKIKRQTEKHGWEFIFLAANIDAAETAENIGIRRERAANYRQTSEGVERSYYAMSAAITTVRNCCADEMDLEKYLNEDEK